jgi:transposase
VIALAKRALATPAAGPAQPLGRRRRKHDPLYRIRRVLPRGAERLNQRGWEQLEAALVAGDPHDEALDAWLANCRLSGSVGLVNVPILRSPVPSPV